MANITSRENQFIKTAIAARERRAGQLFMAEGIRLTGDLIESHVDLEFALSTPEFAETERGNGLLERLARRGVETHFVSEKLIDHIADTRSPQGIVVIGRQTEMSDHDVSRWCEMSGKLPLVAVLYEIGDPANVGSVLRSAEAAGVAGVVLTENSADPFNPKSVRASMGSLFRLPILRGANVFKLIDDARQSGFVSVGAGVAGSVGHFEFDWQRKTMLFLGSEAHGLPNAVIEKLDAVVKIEMAETIESLNLAVSAGLLFFEAKRQLRF